MDQDDPYRHASVADRAPNPYDEREGRGPEGLGGWLIAVAAILGLSAAFAILSLGLAVFGSGLSGHLSPEYLGYVRARVAVDALLLPLALVALTLFWRKSPWFPREFVAWAAAAALGKGVRPWMMAMTGEVSLVMALATPLLWALLWYGPWIVYILRSRRVRNTFAARR